MSKIVDINELIPHKVSEVICIGCQKRWVAVRPVSSRLVNLMCPQCHNIGLVIETGETFDDD